MQEDAEGSGLGASPSHPATLHLPHQSILIAHTGMMAEDEGSQDTLRLQFRAMQEMQHKRLQKQMEKRKEKELSLQSRGDDQKEPLEMSDGLSVLQAGEQNSKTSFEQRVLEDEIEQLRDQLRETDRKSVV